MVFRENIGENLRTLRKSQTGLSVAKIVDIINDNGYELSIDTYYKWERGTRKPPCEAIPYIAQALGTSEEKIFHLHEKDEEEKVCDGKEHPLDVARMYASMGRRDRNLVLDLMLRLYEQEKDGERI